MDTSRTRPPPHRRSSSYFPETPEANQLGVTLHTPQVAHNEPLHPPQTPSNQNSFADISANDDIITSTPSHPLLDLPPMGVDHISPELMVDKAVTGFLGTNPLIGMDPIIAYSWVHTIDGNKVLIYPIDASFSEDTKCQIAEKLELAIAHHLGCLEVTVTTPTAIPGFESRNNDNRRPWCYLLSDISGENLQTLLTDGFIANKHASLHIIVRATLP